MLLALLTKLKVVLIGFKTSANYFENDQSWIGVHIKKDYTDKLKVKYTLFI